MSSARVDLRGKKFDKLLVLEFSRNMKYGEGNRTKFICVCDCGNFTEVAGAQLTRKDERRTRSCNCMNRKGRNGLSTTRLYKIWYGIIWRCTNPKYHNFNRYGGRGITVCEEWNIFENFMEWAKNNGYKKDLTIERKNNDGNYEPNNCTWATKLEQGKNQSQNVHIEFNGETHILEEWSRILGIPSYILRGRRCKGKEGEELFIPHRKSNNYADSDLIELYAKDLSWKEIAVVLNISTSTVGNAVKRLGISGSRKGGKKSVKNLS